ncbi:MAG: transposase [Bacteroidota bacterium]
MNPREITDVKVLQDLVVELVNRVEELSLALSTSEEGLAAAQDEINRLKGEQGRPRFPRRKRSKLPKVKQRPSKPSSDSDPPPGDTDSCSPPEVDRCIVVDTPPVDLPADAVFKGYRKVYQTDVLISRQNTEYQIARWYSATCGKSYESSLPTGATAGIGSSLRSLIQVLHHGGDMTHRKISELLTHLGIELSSGTISNVLTHNDWVESEYEQLLPTILTESPYIQMDSTVSRQSGKGMHTQVLCGEFFSFFSTQPGRSRLDVYAALQGSSRQAVQLAYTPVAIERMKDARVSKKHLAYFAKTFKLGAVFSVADLQTHFESASVFTKTNRVRCSAIAGALAAGYYAQQDQVPRVGCLLTDDASEYRKIAAQVHLHCWVHAIRHYRKLSPTQPYLRSIHQDFLDRLWNFYDRLRSYQKQPPDQQESNRQELIREFDQLFDPHTDYQQLNYQIELTLQKRAFLLGCLQFPEVPLHNNAAERAARRVVRKRNISLHTWSQRGTRIRDAFMSLHQTAKKLPISFLDYLKQRNAGESPQWTIPQLVKMKYQTANSTAF